MHIDDDTTTLTAQQRIDQIEKRRAQRRDDLKAQRLEQYAIDVAALDELEEKHGDTLSKIELAKHVVGFPTFLVFRLPSSGEVKRYHDQIKDRGKRKGDYVKAGQLLSDSCRLYPEKELYEQVVEHFGMVRDNSAVRLIKASQGKEEEEGKE